MNKMQQWFEESNEIMDVLEQFEGDYCSSKRNLNKLDKVHLLTFVNIKTLKQCYRIIKGHLEYDNPQFDQQKMDHTLNSLNVEIAESSKRLSKAKGEYIGVNDTVINKDSGAFKINQLKKQRSR